jgi:hypothetical protein
MTQIIFHVNYDMINCSLFQVRDKYPNYVNGFSRFKVQRPGVYRLTRPLLAFLSNMMKNFYIKHRCRSSTALLAKRSLLTARRWFGRI